MIFPVKQAGFVDRNANVLWDSWVMLDDAHTFVPLPGEKTLFISPPRTALSLDAGNAFPGKEPLTVSCSNGTAILTNQRVKFFSFPAYDILC